jgi:integrase
LKYVHFTRGSYKVRVTVPPELRAIIGKRELTENLGSDKRLAERRSHGVIARFLATIEDARQQADANRPTLSTLAKRYFREQLELDDRGRQELGHDVVAGLHEKCMPILASQMRLVMSGELSGEPAEERVAGLCELLEKEGYRSDLPRAELIKMLAGVELDVLAAGQALDQYQINLPTPRSPLLTEPDPEPVQLVNKEKPGGKGPTLRDILTAFHKERQAGRNLADKTKDEHASAVRMFEEFLGRSVPARQITRKDVLAYKQSLLETPARYVQRFPGLTLPQAIRANQKRKDPFATLDPSTINMKWLSHLSTIFKWGMNNGYVDDNPAAGVRVDSGKGYKEPSRVAFDNDDLRKMFGSPLFRNEAWSTKQWALLLALYTGARSSSELARIRLSDVYQEQGINVIHLALASKNVRSKRIVPIHRDLVELGFLDYLKSLRASGSTRLFADWEPEDAINRWFLRSYRSEVGINDRRKVFHSFRHTLKTALARHGVNRDVSDLITGHADQSVAATYITDASVTMVEAMADGLNRVRFGLPLMSAK